MRDEFHIYIPTQQIKCTLNEFMSIACLLVPNPYWTFLLSLISY